MTVKQLKQMLADAPDDMKIMVLVEDHLHPGMFAFAEACEGETGIATLGPSEEGIEYDETVFLVLPHGYGIPEEDIEDGKEAVPGLN